MMQRIVRFGLGSCAALAVAALSFATPGADARSSTMYAAPDYCQEIEDTGQLITIPWASAGCGTAREAMRVRIAARNKFPGRYPPLTCIAYDHHRYEWDAPLCTHARNRYAAGAIRPVYFGAAPSRRANTPAPAMMAPAPMTSPAASASPSGVRSHVLSFAGSPGLVLQRVV